MFVAWAKTALSPGVLGFRCVRNTLLLNKRYGCFHTATATSPSCLNKKCQVLGFEARHVLPLAEVNSVVLLGTALDLSASLVVTTKGGDEVMFVFPGQRTATLEPVELLIRQLARVAKEESADNP